MYFQVELFQLTIVNLGNEIVLSRGNIVIFFLEAKKLLYYLHIYFVLVLG